MRGEYVSVSEALTFLHCLFFAKYSTNIDSDFYFVCLSSIYSAVYFSWSRFLIFWSKILLEVTLDSISVSLDVLALYRD